MQKRKRIGLSKAVISILVIVFLLGLTNCSKQMGQGPTIVNDLQNTPLSKANVYDDMNFNITKENGAQYEYTFDKTVPNIKEGDFIIHHIWPKTHQVRKVVSVQKNGKKLTVTTTDGNFNEMAKAAYDKVTKSGKKPLLANKIIAVNEIIEYDDGTYEVTKQLGKKALKVIGGFSGTDSINTNNTKNWLSDQWEDAVDFFTDDLDINYINEKVKEFFEELGRIFDPVANLVDIDFIMEKLEEVADLLPSISGSARTCLAKFEADKGYGSSATGFFVKLNIEAELEACLKFKMKMSLSSLLQELNAIFYTNLNFKLEGILKSKINKTRTIKKQILSRSKTYYFMVGPIPVWITVTGTVNGKITTTVNGMVDAYVDINGKYTYEKGMKYDGGWSTSGNGLIQEDYNSRYKYNIHANASLKPSIEGVLDVKIYSAIGPRITAEPYLELTAQIDGATAVGATADIGIYAGIDVFFGIDSHILDKYLNYGPKKIWDYRKTILSKTVTLINAPNPSKADCTTCVSPGFYIPNTVDFDSSGALGSDEYVAYVNCMIMIYENAYPITNADQVCRNSSGYDGPYTWDGSVY